MPSSTNILLNLPGHGAFVDSWDQPVNDDFSVVDGYLGGVQTISVSSTNVTLTAPAGTPTPTPGPTQAQNAVLRFTGTLTANVAVVLPMPGVYVAENLTTGSFVLSLWAGSPGGGEVICLEQGSVQRVYCDGTNVRFVNLPPVGTYWDICDASYPAWIANCTKPPFLLCNGGTFSSATYPYLAAKLGSTTLPDFRGVSPAYLNQGTGRITTAGSGINGDVRLSIGGAQTVTLAASQIPTITSGVSVGVSGSISGNTDQAVTTATQGAGVGGGGAFGVGAIVHVSGTFSGSGSGSATSNNTAGQAHTNMQPTTISGIRLIRAA